MSELLPFVKFAIHVSADVSASCAGVKLFFVVLMMTEDLVNIDVPFVFAKKKAQHFWPIRSRKAGKMDLKFMMFSVAELCSSSKSEKGLQAKVFIATYIYGLN